MVSFFSLFHSPTNVSSTHRFAKIVSQEMRSASTVADGHFKVPKIATYVFWSASVILSFGRLFRFAIVCRSKIMLAHHREMWKCKRSRNDTKANYPKLYTKAIYLISVAFGVHSVFECETQYQWKFKWIQSRWCSGASMNKGRKAFYWRSLSLCNFTRIVRNVVISSRDARL